jgi:hypothetical protein
MIFVNFNRSQILGKKQNIIDRISSQILINNCTQLTISPLDDSVSLIERISQHCDL